MIDRIKIVKGSNVVLGRVKEGEGAVGFAAEVVLVTRQYLVVSLLFQEGHGLALFDPFNNLALAATPFVQAKNGSLETPSDRELWARRISSFFEQLPPKLREKADWVPMRFLKVEDYVCQEIVEVGVAPLHPPENN